MFLWLGNYSLVYSADTCAAENNQWQSWKDSFGHFYSCEDPNSAPSACGWFWQNCIWSKDCSSSKECCICNEKIKPKGPGIIPTNNDIPSVLAPLPSCNGKDNTHLNTLGICVCNDGWKDVNHVCEPCNKAWVCCWISLNTSVPFIGKCIEFTSSKVYKSPDETGVSWADAFPVLMWSLVKILVTVILIISFVLIVIGGIMIATGDPAWGKKIIMKVVVGIALLGASGVILRLINPNFFG